SGCGEAAALAPHAASRESTIGAVVGSHRRRPRRICGCRGVDARMRRMRRAGPVAVGAPCESRNVPLDFTAIDFETANGSSASACSVGLVKVRDGQVVDRIGWLIQPPPGHGHFVEWNTRIHGIRAADVRDALGWVEQLPELLAFAGGDILVAHNAGFDMGVIKAACLATDPPVPAYDYMCSLQLARKT